MLKMIRIYILYLTSGFIILLAALFLSSCFPEPGGPNPVNYELYVKERDQYPAYSPDGEQIAYYHFSSQLPEPVDYPSGLYIINKDGSNRRLVLEGHHYSPAWSPDGQWLVFSTQGVIQKCKTNGEGLTPFVGLNNLKFYFPDWSDDGQNILFDNPLNPNAGIYSMTNDFQNAERIQGIDPGRDADFSPDGTHFVYYAWVNNSEPSEIFIVDISLLNRIRLTKNSRDDRSPTWSPDGSKITWSSNVEVRIINNDGSNEKFLGYGQYPSWSINDHIVFSHANSVYTKEVLYSINSDGTSKKQISF